MNAVVTYQNELMSQTGKRSGVLRPDASGYRTMNVGAIGVNNSGGQFYESTPDVIALFSESSNLQRRVAAGRLFGELGHPKMDGLNEEQFLVRVLSLYEEKECSHFRKVRLVPGVDENGRNCIVTEVEVKPSGVFGAVVEEKFLNGDADVCYSIRCMTDVRRDYGRIVKRITEIVTWDYVGEPGIAIASKYRSPSTEALDVAQLGLSFSEGQLIKAREYCDRLSIGLENGGAVEFLDRLIDARVSRKVVTVPASFRW